MYISVRYDGKSFLYLTKSTFSAAGKSIFWDSFNGNSTSLQKLVMALIPKDFDATSNDNKTYFTPLIAYDLNKNGWSLICTEEYLKVSRGYI